MAILKSNYIKAVLEEDPEIVADILREKAEADDQAAGDLLAKLDARRFNFLSPPPRLPAIFTMRDMAVATPGNITVVQAKVKAGKTALISAMLAAALNPEAAEEMTLGVRSVGAAGRAVVHFDCEQSNDDHDSLIRLTLRRAGIEEEPANLRSYCLTDIDPRDRFAMLRLELERIGDAFAIFLDGVADLSLDVNDAAEANALVAEIHRMAIIRAAGLVAVLHENPGSDIGKTRGHLGSNLERKQFAGLRLEKGLDEITTVWTDRSRKASIPKSQGLRFAYSKESGMHLPVDSANDVRAEAAADELVAFAASIFHMTPNGGLPWNELRDRIVTMGKIGASGARKRLEKMHAAGIIQKNIFHKYELSA